MYHYEKFIMEKFPRMRPHIEHTVDSMDVLHKCRKNASRYLEASCSAVFGYTAEIHLTNDNHRYTQMIPSVFDTAFILDIILDVDQISPKIVSALTTTIIDNRRDSGFWNYMLNVDDVSNYMCPDDIDDTSVCTMGLYLAGKLSDSECREIAEKMLDGLILNEKGEMSAWLQTEDTENRIMYRSLLGAPRIDIGSITNTLWFLSNFGMDSDERVVASANLIENYINHLTSNGNGDEEIDGMVYYSNKFVLYFLISRYIKSSKKADNRLKDFVRKELLEIELSENVPTLNVACIVLAAFNLDIHKTTVESSSEANDNIPKVLSKLLDISKYFPDRQNEDGSFDPWMVYHWYRTGEYGGSKAISTALVLSAITKIEKEILK